MLKNKMSEYQETSTKMCTTFSIGFDYQYEHFGNWTLISDPLPNKAVLKKSGKVVPTKCKNKLKQKRLNPQNNNFNQFYWKFWCSQNATNTLKLIAEHGYICPQWLSCPPTVTLTLKLKYKKVLLLRCINHFISNLINNMDHMHILGTELLSLAKTK